MDNPESPTVYAKSGAPVTPLLRTVLLADLVDSTAAIEKLGDVRAASLMQRLDLRLRDLLEITNGRLIDKADGLFALFERPIQAVDFALRYQRALMELGREENIRLQARVGMHVGEVMTWENPPAAVIAGAKPLEVEGLAKPVAARLMSLALPGQILLSGMAQSLAHRAQGELGERGRKLRWLVHGRYRFKGVPAPMLVHEVGESDLAPLRMPPSGAKVWREVPLWRRPPILAVEVLAVVGLAVFSLYGTFKSPPALAFNERDWVVVGDLNNLTGDARLDDPLETALRISLQQSSYVNLIAQPRIDDALARMARKPGTPIDRSTGSEIAQRESAKALILPTLTEVGGKLRISLEVIDPNTQVTVYTETAEGKGEQTLLASLDSVNHDLREQLGEKVKMIEGNNLPLAKVTTPSLEALRAYSLAQKAYSESRNTDAVNLYQQALKLDPDFALAYAGLAAISATTNDTQAARDYLQQALAHRDRLTRRDALKLDGYAATFERPEVSLQKYRLLAAMYPDEYSAYYNYAYNSHNFAQNDLAGLNFLTPALTSNNYRQVNSYYLQGLLQLSLSRYSDAIKSFQQSESLGVRGYKREYAETYAAQRNYAQAEKILRLQTPTGAASDDIEERFSEITFPLDQGKWSQAVSAAAQLQPLAEKAQPTLGRRYRSIELSLRSYAPDEKFKSDLQSFVHGEISHADDPHDADANQSLFDTLAGGWMAAHSGNLPLAREARRAAADRANNSGFPALSGMAAALDAELALQAGQSKQAIEILQHADTGTELYFLHALLARAYAASGKHEDALRESDWLVANRGRAYAEGNADRKWQPINVAESDLALLSAAEQALAGGHKDLARQRLKAFDQAWPKLPELPELRNRVTSLRLLLSKN
jgi:putative peptide modification system cyclase